MTQTMSTRTSMAGSRVTSPKTARRSPIASQRMVVRASSGTVLTEVPDRNKRTLMNWLLVGALGLPGTALLGPFAYYFVPKRCAHLPRTLSQPRRSHVVAISAFPPYWHDSYRVSRIRH